MRSLQFKACKASYCACFDLAAFAVLLCPWETVCVRRRAGRPESALLNGVVWKDTDGPGAVMLNRAI